MARRGRKPKRKINWSNHASILKSALALLLVAAGVLSAIAIFAGFSDSSGVLNSHVKVVFTDIFGLIGVFISVMFVYAGLLLLTTRRSKVLNGRLLIGVSVTLIALMGMLGGIAGTAGNSLQSVLAEYVSTPGAVFIYFILLIFSIAIITNKGLHEYVDISLGFFGKLTDKTVAVKMPDDGEQDDEIPPMEDNEKPEEGEQLELEEGEDSAIDGEIYDEADDLSTDDSTDKEGLAEGEYDESQETRLQDERSFELVHPPSGPVGEGYLGENGSDGAALADGKASKGQNASGTSGTTGASDAAAAAGAPAVDAKGKSAKSKSAGDQTKLPFTNKIWSYPPVSILNTAPNRRANAGNIQERAKIIEETLKAFAVKSSVVDMHVGPAVTQYAISLAAGTKTSKVSNLATDLALRLKSPSGSVRVEAPIPGTNLVGIEVPNFSPSTVSLHSILNSKVMKKEKNKLAIGLGHNVAGKPIVQNISKWPHCLVAGATGSGKSVMLNAIISTLLFRCSPSECRMIMIDPKLVELSQYNGIPHLLTPVVTDVEQKAVSAFAWAVAEMERRYKVFANAGVRNLDAYNQKSGFQALPYIVIVVDEIADLMMIAAAEVEKYIIRLAQKSRATGIHLILATQRPSVNIITGTIKANVPTRMAFKVTSQVDSRVILDQIGAETLIGRGDMLFTPPDDSKPSRIQGAFISDKEIGDLVEYLKNSGVEPDYQEEITEQKVAVTGSSGASGNVEGIDDKMVEALEVIIADNKASASYLQRRLGVGYSRAARMIDDMEDAGIIGQARGSKPRDVLVVNTDEALERLKGEKDEGEQGVTKARPPNSPI